MEYRDPRATEARRLRREEGMSSKEIRARLNVNKSKLQYWLAGLSTTDKLRPQARDELKNHARALRQEGKTYDEIAEVLQVSKSSISLWVRDIPVRRGSHPGWTEEARKRRADSLAAKRERQRAEHLAHQAQLRTALEPFAHRDLLIGGAIAYWCEGAKTKPWRPAKASVQFINTDPALLRVFLGFLAIVPVFHGGPTYRLHIHETADEAHALEYWRAELDFSVADTKPTQWKRHNPKTNRRNRGEAYYGCVEIYVRRSTRLYWYIEDLARAVMTGMSDANEKAEAVA